MVRDEDAARGTTPCSLAVGCPPRKNSLWSLDHYRKVRRHIPGCDCKGMAVDAEYGIIKCWPNKWQYAQDAQVGGTPSIPRSVPAWLAGPPF